MLLSCWKHEASKLTGYTGVGGAANWGCTDPVMLFCLRIFNLMV